MKELKKVVALILAVIMVCGIRFPASAYNAPASEDTGGLSGTEMAKTVAEEGMVLLKNNIPNSDTDKALPIADGEDIALFGINQIDYVYGGGGSGNFQSEYYVSLWDGLKEKQNDGRITLYKDLYDTYLNYYEECWATDISYAYGTIQGAVLLKYGEMALSDSQVTAAASNARTAIISIGRAAGEDTDRSNAKGDFLLSANEEKLIEQVKAAGFDKIIVVLNVSGVMDTSWFIDDEDIDAVLMVYLPGMVGGNAMADVLLGDSYPSGKLVDTWASSYNDYPSSNNFGTYSYTKYEEDIFVGYRYFETIAPDKVNYEFGYGLSYADLEISDVNVDISGSGRDRVVNVSAKVTNNSAIYSGKEVVQVYYGAPEGELTQPAKELAAFVKTKELGAGESQTVTINFDFDDMASYDDVGKTDYQAAYVLEAGEYKFYVGNSVKNVTEASSYTLGEIELVEQLANRMVPDTSSLIRRLTSDGTYETLSATTAAAKTTEDAEEKYTNPPESDDPFITFKEVVEYANENPEDEELDILTTFVSRLTDEEVIKLTGCTTPVSGMGHRTGLAGLDAYGVPIIGTSNGPAGIQYNDSDGTYATTSTFYPCATMQASTWNVELVQQLGAAIGSEARYFGMSLWQAPGMNLHRDPLCGRNFEYFSEDPLITGKIGASITNGVQSQNFASQLKHFAANNQEYGRWGNDSQMSERALREIYLKGFEIAVKEAQPWSIMSSYNKINGTQTSGNYELLTEILRYEWGFEGFVMTDFRTSGVTHVQEIIAGNDVKAPADSPQPAAVLAALEAGTIERWQIERSAERLLRFVLKTEDAQAVLDNFEYVITLSVDSDNVTVVGDSIKLSDTLTWGEFAESILNNYNQTYVLLDADDNVITDTNTILTVGMKLRVIAEDEITTRTFSFSNQSIALNKPAKASYVEGSYTADLAVDGDYNTRWSGFAGNYVWGNWLEVDLGDAYHITQIDIAYYKGEERSYSYEIWTRAEDGDDWSETSTDRDFSAAGYTNVITDSSEYEELKTDAPDTYGRYVAVKVTGAVNAYGPSILELDVFGWKLSSDEYVIDESAMTIKVPDGDTTTDFVSKVTLNGSATMELSEGSTWLKNGDTLTVTDSNGKETVYTIVLIPILSQPESNKDLIKGEYAKLSVTTSQSATCQWYSNTTASNEGGTAIEGATKNELIIPSDETGTYYYYCVVNGEASKVATVVVTEDLALRKPIKASYEEGTNAAANANDGDNSTRWSAYLAGNLSNHWIEVDLGAAYDINQIDMRFYNGTSRTYNYEIWVRTDTDDDWSRATDDNTRDFEFQGYELALTSSASQVEVGEAVMPSETRARYIAVRVTGGSGASTLTATLYSLEIFGWRIESDIYEIDKSDKSITVPYNTSKSDFIDNVRLIGSGEYELSSGDTLLNGDKLTVTDINGYKTVYNIVVISEGTDATEIRIDTSSLVILRKNSTLQLNLSVIPLNATPKVTWTSSNSVIASVDENGFVTANKVGTVQIKASTDNGLVSTIVIRVSA